MPDLTQLRLVARKIFDDALRAVDPRAALTRSVHLTDSRLTVFDTAIELGSRKIFSIAIGKAALPMALALEDLAGDRISAGFIAGPIAGQPLGREIAFPRRKLSTRWRWVEGGHPLPTKHSLAAAELAFDLLRQAEQDGALIIFLISGGGSAMIEWPINNDITLADLRTANRALIECGASISEINAVRRAFSSVKGGRLAAKAPRCNQITLIVSDVPGGEERNVASGPTLAPDKDAPNARQIVERYDLRLKLPAAIGHAIENQQTSPLTATHSLREQFVLLDNSDMLNAAGSAAHQQGFAPEIASDICDQPIADGCSLLLSRLRQQFDRSNLRNQEVTCLVSGGEFACTVKGDGIGGRNLETALRLAIEYDQRQAQLAANFVALCAGTDGVDGNSPAAGAIMDNTTIKRAQAIGLDPQDFLNRSDAYSLFVALGDVVATGPSGTNVRDVRILLASA